MLPPAKARRRWLFVLLALGVALAAGVGWWLWRQSGPSPPPVELSTLDPEVAEAIADARAKVESNRRSGAAWGRLGMVLYAHQLLPEALICFGYAQRFSPREVRWAYYRGRILVGQDPDEGIAALQQAAASHDLAWEVRLQVAEALLERDRLEEADGELGRVSWQQPDHPRVLLLQGQLALHKGDARASLPFLGKAAEHPLTRKTASIGLAEAHQRLGQVEQAAKARQQAVEASPDPPWITKYAEEVRRLQVGAAGRIFRAQNLIADGSEAAGRDLLIDTVKKYPHFYRAHALLGSRYYQKGDLAAAEQWLRETVRLAPDFKGARALLGVVLLQRGNAADAIEQFRGILAQSPNSPIVHFYLGQALLSRNDLDGAIAAFREGLRYSPESSELHLFLSRALAKKGNQADSRTHLQNAIQLSSADPRIQGLIREIQAETGSTKGP